MTVAIITPSYQNDFPLATALCRSMDAMVGGDWVHHLIVSRRDLNLFRSLEGPRRKVLAMEDVMRAHGYRSLPLPRRIRIPGIINRRLREQWWVPGAGRTSGWLVQQIVKLSAPEFTQSEVLIFIDSDVQFVRPCSVEDLTGGELVNLNQHAKGVELETHKRWCRIANELLGLPGEGEPGHNYIGNIICWRRENLLKLQRHIEARAGIPWHRAITNRGDVSEYILYGVFCSEVLGEASGHRFVPSDLAVSVWVHGSLAPAASVASQFSPAAVALHLQSTLALSEQQRNQFIGEVRRELAGHSTA
jgi:Family of unknown function (DUF6492)